MLPERISALRVVKPDRSGDSHAILETGGELIYAESSHGKESNRPFAYNLLCMTGL